MFGLLAMSIPLFAEQGVSQKELKELMGDGYMIEQDYDRAVPQYREILAKDRKTQRLEHRLRIFLAGRKNMTKRSQNT